MDNVLYRIIMLFEMFSNISSNFIETIFITIKRKNRKEIVYYCIDIKLEALCVHYNN